MRLKLLFKNSFILLVVVLAMGASTAFAQTSSFTYQGRLTDGGTSANGNYEAIRMEHPRLAGPINSPFPSSASTSFCPIRSRLGWAWL